MTTSAASPSVARRAMAPAVPWANCTRWPLSAREALGDRRQRRLDAARAQSTVISSADGDGGRRQKERRGERDGRASQ
jgi:hypothetical protein